MKQSIFKFSLGLVVLTLLFPSLSKGQVEGASVVRPVIAVLDFDNRGYSLDKNQVIQFLINELNRTNQYEVLDKYETEYIAQKDSLDLYGCFSKVCLSEFGSKLSAEKMMTGSIQLLGDKINITLRILDVETSVFEKTMVQEFRDIRGKELAMIRVTINELFGIENDPDIVRKLTQMSDYDNSLNNPNDNVLQADGPRMGAVTFTGSYRNIITNPKNHGGYNSYPYMFQFGYQFEKQYLNEGNIQGLVEFLPMFTGLDQGRLIPSFTFLNGFRNNKSGWEFAFGPSFSMNYTKKGFYHDANGNGIPEWYLEEDLVRFPGHDFDMERRPDSRGKFLYGDLRVSTGLLFAVGKTFRSGNLNIPVNAFFIPGVTGSRVGMSFGWNTKNKN